MKAQRLLRLLDDPSAAAFGAALHSPDPAIVEIAALAGYDWVSIILEHSPLTVPDIGCLQRAADARNLTTLIHVSSVDDPRILPLLNEGVGGIVAPQVSTPDEARRLVSSTRFPPLGDRGAAGSVRSADYGAREYAEYAAEADSAVAVGVIIENSVGLGNVEAILAVEGLTLAYIGLMDMSQSLGVPGDFKHPEVRAAVERIVAAANASGVAIGMSEYGYTVEELLDLGIRLIITPSSEYKVLLVGLRSAVAAGHTAAANRSSRSG